MSSNNQPLSGSGVTPLQRSSLNTLITSIVLDSDTANSSCLITTGGTNSMYIDKFSNVGINTTSPGAQLEVASANGSCVRLRYGATSAISNIFLNSSGVLSLTTSGLEVNTNGSLNLSAHDGSTVGLKLGGTLVTATATQLNYTAVSPIGTAAASKALVVDSNRSIDNINALIATQLTGTLQTAAQPNITSVGTIASLTVGDITVNGSLNISGGSVSTALGYLSGITPGTATASKALVLDSLSNIVGISNAGVSSITIGGNTLGATQSAYLTSISAGTASPSKALVLNSSSVVTGIVSIGTTDIVVGGNTLGGTEVAYITSITPGTASVSKALVLNSSGAVSGLSSIGTTSITIGGNTLGATESAYLTSITAGTASVSKALVLNSSGAVSGLSSIGTTAITIGGNTLGATESAYLTSITAGTASGSKAIVLDSSRNIININALTAAQITGTLQTANQSNITAVGSLGSLTVTGATILSSSSDATSSSSGGALTITGGLAVGLSSFIGGNLTVGGNLVINGSSTTVNATTVAIKDNILLLNASPSGSYDGGIVVQRFQNPNDTSVGDVISDTAKETTTVSSATSTTVVLTTGNASNNYYVGWWVSINSNVRYVTAYVGSTKTITVSTGFTSTPTGGATVLLYNRSNAALTWNESNKQFATTYTANNSSIGLSTLDYASMKVDSLFTLGSINTSDTTESSSVSTGSIITSGGMGVSKALYVGNGIYGTIQTAAQTSITALGTLSALSVTSTGNPRLSTRDTSTNASSVALDVEHLLSSGTAATGLGVSIRFNAPNSAGTVVSYGRIDSVATSVASGSLHAGKLDFYTVFDGSHYKAMALSTSSTNTSTLTLFGTSTLSCSVVSSSTLALSGSTASTSNTTGTLTLAGGIGISNTTDATSSTNGGTLTTAGGAAIAKALYVGGTLFGTTLSGSTLALSSSTNSVSNTTGTLTLAGGIGISNTTDATSSTNGGTLTTAGGAAIAKALYVGGTLFGTIVSATSTTLSGSTTSTSNTTGVLTLAGGIGISNTTDATSSTNGGTLTTAGGAAIAKALYVGGTLFGTTLSGSTLALSNSTASTSNTTGALTLTGGIGISNTTDATSSTNGGTLTTAGGAAIAKALYVGGGIYGTISTAAQTSITSLGTLTALVVSGNLNLSGHNGSSTGLQLGGSLVTAVASEINVLTGVNAGTAAASKALVLNSSSAVSGISSIGTTTLVLGGTTVTASASEINTLTGVVAGTASASKALVLSVGSAISGISSVGTTTLVLGGSSLGSTQANYLTSISPGSASASKALVVDSSVNISGLNAIALSGITLNSSYSITGYSIILGTSGAKSYTTQDTFRALNASATTLNNSFTLGSNTDSNHQSFAYVAAPTLTATNTLVTTTNASTLYITGAPIASTNMTITNTYAMYIASGTAYFGGSISLAGNTFTSTQAGYLASVTAGTATAGKAMVTDGSNNISGVGGMAFGSLSLNSNYSITGANVMLGVSSKTYGNQDAFRAVTAINTTLNNSFTASSSTDVAHQAYMFVGTPTLTASNTSVTTTNASSVYISSAPIASTNMAITNAYALYVASGTAYFGGSISLAGNTFTSTQAGYLASVTAGTATAGKAMVTDGSNNISGVGGMAFGALSINSSYSLTANNIILGSTTKSYTNSDSFRSLTANNTTLNNSFTSATGTDVSHQSYVFVGTPTLTATNASVTTTNASTLYIANAPVASTNMTIGNAYALYVASGVAYFGGGVSLAGTLINGTQLAYLSGVTPGTATASKALITDSSNNISGINGMAFGSLGINASYSIACNNIITSAVTRSYASSQDCRAFTVSNITLNNSVIASSGTDSGHQAYFYVGAPTVTASNTSVTTTNMSTLYIANAPIASTNMSITNPYALYVAAGTAYFGGSVSLAGTLINGTQLAYLSGVTAGTAAASKALITDSSNNISGINGMAFGSLTANASYSITCNNMITSAVTRSYASAAAYRALTISSITMNNSTTATSGTDSGHQSYVYVGVPTMTATNTSVTTTNATSFYIAGAPTSGSNMTITNGYALYIESGTSYFAGSISAAAGITLSGVSFTSTQAGFLSGVTAGTATASKALVIDSNKDLATIRNLTMSGTLSGVTTISNSSTITNTLSTASTSNSTGAVLLSGGIGISNTTDASSITNGGTFTTAGGAAVSKSLYVGTSFTVGGSSISASAWGASGIQSKYLATNYTDSSTAGFGTVALSTFNSFAQPTLLTTNSSVTVTAAATVYIANAPVAGGANSLTISNPFALYVASGSSYFGGNINMSGTLFTSTQAGFLSSVTAGTASASKAMVLDGSKNIVGISGLAFDSLGINSAYDITAQSVILGAANRTYNSPDTFRSITLGNVTMTNTATSAFGTDSTLQSYAYVGVPTMAANNSSVTTTSAATVYIAGAPAAGTNMTLTNTYAMYVNAGRTLLAGNCFLGTGTSGGVCIGTSTDTARLLSCLNSAQSISSPVYITLGRSNDGNNQAELSFQYEGSGSTNNRFDIGFYGSTRLLSVAASGNVGIGQTSPAYPLDLNSTARNVHISVYTDVGSTYGFGANNSSLQSFSGGAFDWYTTSAPVTDVNATRGTSLMTLTSAGALSVVSSLSALSSTDASSSSSGGAFTSSGGGAFAKSLYVGTTFAVGGTTISASAWGASGIQSRYTSTTFNDSSTSASGTASLSTFNSFAQPTLSATNSSVTTTNAATIYIADAPAAGTNMTITNSYAMYVASGTAYFGGDVSLAGTLINTTQLAYLNGVTPGTATASKALIVDSSSNISGLNSLTFGALTPNASYSIVTNNILTSATTRSYASSDTFRGLTISNITLNNSTTANSGTDATHQSYIFIGSPTVTATNTSVTTTNMSSFYIAGAPTASTNMTITNAYALYVAAGTSFFGGSLNINGTLFTSTQAQYLSSITAGTASASKALVLDSSSNLTGPNNITSTRFFTNATTRSYTSSTEFRGLNVGNITLNNSVTASSGTDAGHQSHTFIGAPTITASNTSVTTTTMSTFYISGAPIASTNMTITNPYALYVAGGKSYLGGMVAVNSTVITAPSFGIDFGAPSQPPAMAINMYSGTRGFGASTSALDYYSDAAHKWFYNTSSQSGNNSTAPSGTNTMTLSTTGVLTTASGIIAGSTSSTNSFNLYTNDSTGAGTINCTGGTSSAVAVQLQFGTTTGFWGTSTNHGFGIMANNVRRIFIGADGNVGIGSGATSSPGYPLEVSSGGTSSTVSNYHAISGQTTSNVGGPNTFGVSFKVSSGRAWFASEVDFTSDYRIKKDIDSLTDSFARTFVQTCNPVRYRYRTQADGSKYQFGFIAQELIKSNYGDLVNIDYQKGMVADTDSDGFMSPDDHVFNVSYTNIIAIIAQSQKEMYTTIDDHKRTIDAHEATIETQSQQISDLESRLARLEALLQQ